MQNHRKSISMDSRKPMNSTFRTTQLSSPKQMQTIEPQTQTKIFTKSDHKQLQLYRKIFPMSRPKTTCIDFTSTIPIRNETYKKNVLDSYEFPSWLRNRTDFKNLRKSKYFNVDYKVLSICEIDQFKRNDEQKEQVANYLQRLAFFRLMPQQMLHSLAGRVLAKNCEENEIVCQKGEKGESLFIIFDGQLEVVEKGLKFGKNAILGRNALDGDCPRSATLKACQQTHLLLLNRIDYVTILSNVMKVESVKQEAFIRSLPVFQHFTDDKIKKFCNALQGQFLTPFDTLYSAGDLVDSMYIVKNGVLIKKVVMDLEDQNRWPINNKKWMSKSITRTVGYDIEYKVGSLVGYFDVIDSEFDTERRRIETIDAKEDCFLLYISKSKFFQIFSSGDIQYFENYHAQHNPMTYDQIVSITRTKEQEQKKKMNILNEAVYNHLQQYSYDFTTLQTKTKKYSTVFKNSFQKFQNFKEQYKLIRQDKHYKILTSQYE